MSYILVIYSRTCFLVCNWIDIKREGKKSLRISKLKKICPTQSSAFRRIISSTVVD